MRRRSMTIYAESKEDYLNVKFFLLIIDYERKWPSTRTP